MNITTLNLLVKKKKSDTTLNIVDLLRVWIENETTAEMSAILINTGLTRRTLEGIIPGLETLTESYSRYLMDYIKTMSPTRNLTTSHMLYSILRHPGNSIKTALIRSGCDTGQLLINLGNQIILIEHSFRKNPNACANLGRPKCQKSLSFTIFLS